MAFENSLLFLSLPLRSLVDAMRELESSTVRRELYERQLEANPAQYARKALRSLQSLLETQGTEYEWSIVSDSEYKAVVILGDLGRPVDVSALKRLTVHSDLLLSHLARGALGKPAAERNTSSSHIR